MTGVTVTTGAARVVSAVVSFFEESTRQPARSSGRREAGNAGSGRREAGSGKRKLRDREREISIGMVANVEGVVLSAPVKN